jgi:hypothetical protein
VINTDGFLLRQTVREAYGAAVAQPLRRLQPFMYYLRETFMIFL